MVKRKKIRIGINGLGRIGRHLYRLLVDCSYCDCVLVNEINPDINNIVYTLNYDSIYGLNSEKYHVDGKNIKSNNSISEVSHFNNVDQIPFSKLNLDLWIDATGSTKNIKDIKKVIHKGLLKKVITTFDSGLEDIVLILGANENFYDKKKHHLISAGVCDAVAIAPILKILDELFFIESGFVTTLHPWLNYQNLLDGPSSSWSYPGEIYDHYALGRSSINNIIPKSTTALNIAMKALNFTDEKNLKCFSYRIPTNIVCSADLSINLKKKISSDHLISIFKEIIKKQKYNILKLNDLPLTSVDYIKQDFSVIIDERWTEICNSNLVKIICWYDNEYGYSRRVTDLTKFIFD